MSRTYELLTRAGVDSQQSGTRALAEPAVSCHYTCMRKVITRNQRRLLDGLCDRWAFEQQVELAGEIWPFKSKEIRRSFSRLQNLGFIDWVPQEQTSYEPRWFVTEKGVRYLLDNE